MGLIDKILRGNRIEPVRFAEYVLAHYGGGVGSVPPSNKAFKKECDRLLGECAVLNGVRFSPRIYLLTIAGDRLKGNLSAKELFTKATCYVYAGATCRKKIIETLNEYLSRGDWSNFANDKIQLGGALISRRNALVSSAYIDLAKAYEGEYLFDEAYNSYIKANEMNPYVSFGITGAIEVAVKMTDYERAFDLLDLARKGPYYSPVKSKSQYSGAIQIDDDYKNNIDHLFDDVTDKKRRGYVYKVRKKK